MTKLDDSVLAPLLRVLDMVVLERGADRGFSFLTPLPAWLTETVATVAAGEPITLRDAMPFLDNFLGEAETFWWEDRSGVLTSTPFAAPGAGDDYLVRATAVNLQQRRLLVLERLKGRADPRPVLQTARERLLEYERLVERMKAMHAPVRALDEFVDESRRAGLDTAQRSAVEAVADAAAKMRELLEGVPEPPRRRPKPRL